MREIVKDTIDGHEYEFMQLGARQSFRLLNRLLKTAGPAVAKTLSGFKGQDLKSIMDTELDFDAIGGGIAMLAENLDEGFNETTASLLLESIHYKGRPVSWETETFQGNMIHFLKVLKKAAEVNIGDFFDAFRANAAAGTAAGDTIPAKITSLRNGRSGAS